MVRHEAGEALGAIGTDRCLAPLYQHQEDACLEVAQTCQLALQRIDYYSSNFSNDKEIVKKYLSVDPTPPADSTTPTDILAATLIDRSARIFDRYRAMFALRDRGGTEAVKALTTALLGSESALLKHEVAYVLGQMQDAQAVEALKESLRNVDENAMVRHEAAEALGSIAASPCLDMLKEYSDDAEPIVADSCIIALDMLEFEQSGAFQYADDGLTLG